MRISAAMVPNPYKDEGSEGDNSPSVPRAMEMESSAYLPVIMEGEETVKT